MEGPKSPLCADGRHLPVPPPPRPGRHKPSGGREGDGQAAFHRAPEHSGCGAQRAASSSSNFNRHTRPARPTGHGDRGLSTPGAGAEPAARDADGGENRAESDRLHHRGHSWSHALAPMSTHTGPGAPCTPASPRAGLGAEDNPPSSPAEAAWARGGFLVGSQGVSGATWPPGRVLDHRRFPAAPRPSLGYHCP